MNERESLIIRVWQRRDLLASLLWVLLFPLSVLFSLGVRFRNYLYAAGWIRSKGLPCTVVSVGNLTVGGTGKTPTTLWLAEELGKRGYSVAILSRGYKRTGRAPRVIEPGNGRSIALGPYDPLNEGDEPVMMAAAYGQWVGVGKKRYEVGNQVLRHKEIDVFLLDDGFQHRRLRRDLDLVLLGRDWSGWLVPAGPFREPRSALRRADLYLVTGSRERWESFLTRVKETPSLFYGSLEAKGLLTKQGDCWEEVSLALLSESRVLAVSAIADPVPFYQMIQEWGGEIVDAVEFPDHHRYSIKDWQKINRAARHVDRIVTTEKDVVKLARFPFANERLFALRVMMVVERGGALIETVEKIIKKRKESPEDLGASDG